MKRNLATKKGNPVSLEEKFELYNQQLDQTAEWILSHHVLA